MQFTLTHFLIASFANLEHLSNKNFKILQRIITNVISNTCVTHSIKDHLPLGLAAAFCFVQATENNEKNLCYLAYGISNLYGYCFASWFLIKWTCVGIFLLRNENCFLNCHSWGHGTRYRESMAKKRSQNMFSNLWCYKNHKTEISSQFWVQMMENIENQLFCAVFYCKIFNCKFCSRGS